jgi:formylglycine-generating enzyme required for sulfatase activity
MRRIILVFLFAAFCGSPTFSQNQDQSIAVLNVRSDQLAGGDLLTLTEAITTELNSHGGYRVFGWNDVSQMLEHKAGKQALGCDDEKCFAEIGGALGVTYIAAGNLGKLGDRYILNLKLIDITRTETKARVKRTVSGNMGLLIDELPAMVAELLGAPARSAPAPTPAARPAGAPEGMVSITGGSFMMGSNDGDADEKPVHQVTLDGFSMDKYEVTNQAYDKCAASGACQPAHYDDGTCYVWNGFRWVKGAAGSEFRGGSQPVGCVDWEQARSYCQWKGGRLPTEAEWEYAARGGTSTTYYWGNQMDDSYAWYSANSGSKTHPVGEKRPNQYGLYDMSGNVWEWCGDWYASYGGGTENNPSGPAGGSARVGRGGGWRSDAARLRPAVRYGNGPGLRGSSLGFRCARASR